MTTSAIVLAPSEINNNNFAAGTTIPEVDTARGEVAYVPAPSYVVGNRVNYLGSMWECVLASIGIAPNTDPTRWLRVGPTNRMAPFDERINTAAYVNGNMVYVIDIGFFTGLALYKIVGERINIKIYDAPGGTVVQELDQDLYEQALGLYEYLFMPLKVVDKIQMQDLPLLPTAQVVITISSSGTSSVGMIVLGFWQNLIGSSGFGGVDYGASLEIKSYSYVKTNEDGSTEIIPRSSANNIKCSLTIDANEANNALSILESIASTPVAFIACGLAKYDYLNTFGLVSGDITAESWSSAKINLNVKGYI